MSSHPTFRGTLIVLYHTIDTIDFSFFDVMCSAYRNSCTLTHHNNPINDIILKTLQPQLNVKIRQLFICLQFYLSKAPYLRMHLIFLILDSLKLLKYNILRSNHHLIFKIYSFNYSLQPLCLYCFQDHSKTFKSVSITQTTASTTKY